MRQIESNTRVAHPPSTPVLVYDGACEFCVGQVERWKRRTDRRVDYVPSDAAEIGERFPELPRPSLDAALQLIHTDGRVYSGAHGAIKVLSLNRQNSWLLRVYEASPVCSAVMELGYRLVARNRGLLSRLSPCVRKVDRK